MLLSSLGDGAESLPAGLRELNQHWEFVQSEMERRQLELENDLSRVMYGGDTGTRAYSAGTCRDCIRMYSAGTYRKCIRTYCSGTLYTVNFTRTYNASTT
ncbi:hypothetical protein FKM82_031123 [Ascaphus truei]